MKKALWYGLKMGVVSVLFYCLFEWGRIYWGHSELTDRAIFLQYPIVIAYIGGAIASAMVLEAMRARKGKITK